VPDFGLGIAEDRVGVAHVGATGAAVFDTTTVNAFAAVLPQPFEAVTLIVRLPVPSQSLLIVHVLVDPEFDTVAVTEPSHFAGDKETEVEPTALEAVYAPLTPLKVNDNFVTSELVTTVYLY